MAQPTTEIAGALTFWHRPWGYRLWVGVSAVAVALAAVTWMVYATGGSRLVFAHAMYVPILLAAALFGPGGGLIAGIAGGLAVGPFMPLDTITGEMQAPFNWLTRAGFFMLIGGITGGLVSTAARLGGQDPVSGLPGQLPLHQHLSRRVDRHADVGGFSVVAVTLDNLPEVARTFGPVTGNSFLREFVDWLSAATGRRTRIYHPGGECFVIVVPHGLADAMRQKLTAAVRKPVIANGIPIYLHMSLGRADFPDQQKSPTALVRHAVEAASTTKQIPTSAAALHAGKDDELFDNVELLGELGDAIATDQLRLHHQPRLDLVHRSIPGVEALVRWEHPKRGLLTPNRFLPQTEMTQVISQLTTWVIGTALADAERFQHRGQRWNVAVNLSAPDLRDPELLDVIDAAIESHLVPADRLEIEVSESALVLEPDRAQQVLGDLRDRGITVVIDDFGVESTNITNLQRFPASSVKITRQLIDHIEHYSSKQHVVESIVRASHKLGMTVVAMGIEDGATLDAVRSLGCDQVQGFLFSRPVPADELHGFQYRDP